MTTTTEPTSTRSEVDESPDPWRTEEFYDWLHSAEVTADVDDERRILLFDAWVLSRSRLRTPLGLQRQERALSAADVEFLLGADAAQLADETAVETSTVLATTAWGWSYYLMFLADAADPIPELKERLLTFLATSITEHRRSGSGTGAVGLTGSDPRRQLEDLGALPFVRSASEIVERLRNGPLEGTSFEAGMVRQALFATHLIETSGSLVRPGRRMGYWRSTDVDKAVAARRSLVVWWVHTIGHDLSEQEPALLPDVLAHLAAAVQGEPSTAEPGSLVAAVLSHLGVVPGGVMPVGVRPAVQVGLSRLNDAGIAALEPSARS